METHTKTPPASLSLSAVFSSLSPSHRSGGRYFAHDRPLAPNTASTPRWRKHVWLVSWLSSQLTVSKKQNAVFHLLICPRSYRRRFGAPASVRAGSVRWRLATKPDWEKLSEPLTLKKWASASSLSPDGSKCSQYSSIWMRLLECKGMEYRVVFRVFIYLIWLSFQRSFWLIRYCLWKTSLVPRGLFDVSSVKCPRWAVSSSARSVSANNKSVKFGAPGERQHRDPRLGAGMSRTHAGCGITPARSVFFCGLTGRSCPSGLYFRPEPVC